MTVRKILPVSILYLLFLNSCIDSNEEYYKDLTAYRKEINIMFSDSTTSPLPKEDLLHFKELEFFPVDPAYRVEADFQITPGSETFKMPMSKERIVWYRKYGVAKFTLKGKEFSLAVYQNQDLVKKEGYEDYLFVPFKDLTNGIETYGGGRYIDLRIPDGDKILIDFNKAYNPYCAYNYKYSCPIPPDENHLQVEIKAGVLDYEH